LVLRDQSTSSSRNSNRNRRDKSPRLEDGHDRQSLAAAPGAGHEMRGTWKNALTHLIGSPVNTSRAVSLLRGA
jgi:hypothetical protein